ncbi:ribonuclease HI [Glaciihabitans arcticus]|uniref:ribonuclease H n=1 Tax=Glaciihabitans arcticus TaxID=2668039 RepID=A0A4Q9GTZ5_9MICO|nr:ribonuclease HI [Glaciihabitans arcticus]
MTITASADGSALGNPGPAGWAWYIDDNTWDAGGWKHATNNQGELKAVLELFRATAHVDDDLHILCDSQYVINSVTKWMPGWKKKGWRKGDGKPVMNLELLKEIDEAIAGRRYRFEWVRGHVGHVLNEAADARARAVSEAFARGAAIPTGPGFPGAAPAITAQAEAEPQVAQLSFDFLDEPETQPEAEPAAEPESDIALTPAQKLRLAERARAEGISVSELLARLI